MKDGTPTHLEDILNAGLNTQASRRKVLRGLGLGAGTAAFALTVGCGDEEVRNPNEAQLALVPALDAFRNLHELNGVNEKQALIMLPASLARGNNSTDVLGQYTVLKKEIGDDDAAAAIANAVTVSPRMRLEDIKANYRVTKRELDTDDDLKAAATAIDIMDGGYSNTAFFRAHRAAKKLVGDDNAAYFTSASFWIDLNTDDSYALYEQVRSLSKDTPTRIYYMLLAGSTRGNTGNLQADLDTAISNIKTTKKQLEDKPGDIAGFTKPTLIDAVNVRGDLDPVFDAYRFAKTKVPQKSEIFSKDDMAGEIVLAYERRQRALRTGLNMKPLPTLVRTSLLPKSA
jgi:hypothetical protein